MTNEEKELLRYEIEVVLEEALIRAQRRGEPHSTSANGNDMQAGGMFWRVCRVARMLVDTDAADILSSPAGTNGIQDMRLAIEGLQK